MEGSGVRTLPDVRNLKLLTFRITSFKRVEEHGTDNIFLTRGEICLAGMTAK